MKVPVILFNLILVAGLVTSSAQIHERAKEVFELSRQSGKPVLLVFSGSDWCAPCIRFQTTILSNEDFQHYAYDHFIILKADFPQRKKLAIDLVKQNERLAEKYNPRGLFPHLLLLNSDESVLTTLYFKNQKAGEFIAQLSSHFAE